MIFIYLFVYYIPANGYIGACFPDFLRGTTNYSSVPTFRPVLFTDPFTLPSYELLRQTDPVVRGRFPISYVLSGIGKGDKSLQL